jgi:protein SCO1/2
MSAWLEKLGDKAAYLNAVFVSVDPERDSVKALAAYLKNFNARITGLTGTPEQVAAMTKAYKVYYKKIPMMDGADYMMDHSASVYLFDADGHLVSTIDQHEPRAMGFAKVGKIVESEK